MFNIYFAQISVGSFTFPINNRFSCLFLLYRWCKRCCSVFYSPLSLDLFLIHCICLFVLKKNFSFCCCFQSQNKICTLIGNFLFSFMCNWSLCVCVCVCLFDCVKSQFSNKQASKYCACVCHKFLHIHMDMLFSCKCSILYFVPLFQKEIVRTVNMRPFICIMCIKWSDQFSSIYDIAVLFFCCFSLSPSHTLSRSLHIKR